MSDTKKMLTGAAVATIAAMLVAFAPVSNASSAEQAQVNCMGINACKGQGACTTAENACNGQNACKGHGLTMTASGQECTDKGGTVVK